MHLLRESALLSVDAPQTTHGTLCGKRVWTFVAIHAHIFITADATATGSLARHGPQEPDLRLRRLVIVTMVTVFGGKLATVGMEVVHVAHLDSLDALDFLPVPQDGRIDALSFLVVTLCGLFRRTRNGTRLWERCDGLRKLGPRLHTGLLD